MEAIKHFSEEVVEFGQTILGIEQRPLGELNDSEYQISMQCLQEELDEFEEAHGKRDFIKQVDALVDLKYFVDGVLYKMGLTAEQIVAVSHAVHVANMTKVRGHNAKRGDGVAVDAVKPEGWVSPEDRISAILSS